MPTANQLKLIHIAARQLDLDDADYRLVLRNVAKVESAKELDNVSFEDVMACFEGAGFRMPKEAEDYWRNKVALRSRFATSREVFEIRRLAEKVMYDLPGLCRKFSAGRTWEPSKLSRDEASKLIEMLKACATREYERAPDVAAELFSG
jgi:hypothetical protein